MFTSGQWREALIKRKDEASSEVWDALLRQEAPSNRSNTIIRMVPGTFKEAALLRHIQDPDWLGPVGRAKKTAVVSCGPFDISMFGFYIQSTKSFFKTMPFGSHQSAGDPEDVGFGLPCGKGLRQRPPGLRGGRRAWRGGLRGRSPSPIGLTGGIKT